MAWQLPRSSKGSNLTKIAKTQRVFIALGSNLGSRLQNLDDAIHKLSLVLSDLLASSIYETPPWGYLDQPFFLNMVLAGNTELPPMELLTRIKEFEVHLGRKPSFQNGPRLIDMDILLFGDCVYQEDGLTIPHPRMHERGFVLVPLAEIAPDLMHPLLQKTTRQLLDEIEHADISFFSPGLTTGF